MSHEIPYHDSIDVLRARLADHEEILARAAVNLPKPGSLGELALSMTRAIRDRTAAAVAAHDGLEKAMAGVRKERAA